MSQETQETEVSALLEQRCIPHLTITDNRCEEALDYYCKIFDGKVIEKKMGKDNKRIIHSQLQLSNGCILFINDEFLEMHKDKTHKLNANQINSVTLNLSFTDHNSAKTIWGKIKSHQSSKTETEIVLEFDKQAWNQYYGNFRDKYGHCWEISAPLEPIKKNTRKRSAIEAKIDDNDDNHNKKRKLNDNNGYLKMEERGKQIVLIYSCIIGEEEGCTHKCFGSAAKEGIGKLYGYLMKHQDLWKKADQRPMAISPDDPKTVKKARYKLGFIMKDCKNMDEIKLDDEDGKQFEIITLDANQWYIYQHIGGYDGLHRSWKQALDDIAMKGYEMVGGLNIFEQYMDDPEKVDQDKMTTLIYLAVKK